MKIKILLTPMEIQSGHNRVHQAESLILQLPEAHEGRNSWLMNYGIGDAAQKIRANDPVRLKEMGYVPRELKWSEYHDCLEGTR